MHKKMFEHGIATTHTFSRNTLEILREIFSERAISLLDDIGSPYGFSDQSPRDFLL